ncbi:MAG: hypothetical protein J6Z02_06265 [Lachnospiraceae bacterium]|nr:hypothetical protein [Lachnospiraceae bacterium]
MKNLHNKKYSGSTLKEVAVPVLTFVAIVVLFVLGIQYIGKAGNKQNLELLRQSLNRAAVECYSIEGIYPPNVEYMEENYGLNYDHDKYFVLYDVFASNIMPTIDVYEKR